MNKLEQLFQEFSSLKVLVVGDVMIDSYLWGATNRISPEAPVPIVEVVKREKRLGGAANVALNIKAMGAEPIMLTVLGKDIDGDDFCSICEQEELSVAGLVKSDSRVTTIKHRIISSNQHILRVDQEQTDSLSSTDEDLLLEKCDELISACDVVIFQDYDKGVLTEKTIREITVKAKTAGIPIAVDPKKKNFNSYTGVDLFKPNLKELTEGTKTDLDLSTTSGVSKVVADFKAAQKHLGLMVTMSERGVLIDKEEVVHHPAHLRTITDVSGAGDTVISVASLALGLRKTGAFISAISNLAGGLVCEKVGVVPIEKDILLKESQNHKLDKWL